MDCVTFGQYMQPTKRHLKVRRGLWRIFSTPGPHFEAAFSKFLFAVLVSYNATSPPTLGERVCNAGKV